MGQCFALFYLAVSHDGLNLLNLKRRIISALLAGEIKFVNRPVDSSLTLCRRILSSVITVVFTTILLGYRLVRLRIVRLAVIIAAFYFFFVKRTSNAPPFV